MISTSHPQALKPNLEYQSEQIVLVPSKKYICREQRFYPKLSVDSVRDGNVVGNGDGVLILRFRNVPIELFF